jgi:hypothetical protein
LAKGKDRARNGSGLLKLSPVLSSYQRYWEIFPVPFLLLGCKWRNQRDKDYLERLIICEFDRFGRALGNAGPALNTFFWMDRIRFVLSHLIDLAGTNLNAVSTT